VLGIAWRLDRENGSKGGYIGSIGSGQGVWLDGHAARDSVPSDKEDLCVWRLAFKAWSCGQC